MSALIAGSAAILPAFTSADATRPSPVAQPVALRDGAQLEDAQFEGPALPLFDRRLSAEERGVALSPDLTYAIMRIEGVYDPTRVDAMGLATRMKVTAGTASMNNVFGDRWHLGDTDANVSYSVRYIAQAWQKSAAEPCDAYLKHRASIGIVELTALEPADCARIARLHGQQEAIWKQLTVTNAPVSVPVFAAPEPGMRMTPEAFWAAQRARIQAIQARIAFQRSRSSTTLASGR